MRKIILIFLLGLVYVSNLFSFAAESDVNDFVIIPESKKSTGEIETIIKDIASGGNVWKTYNEKYKEVKNDLGAQFATGVFSWNSILLFIKYLIKFLSQVGIVIGSLMIIYSGYIYANAVWTGNATKGAEPLKKAILGVIVIIGSYGIMKILTSMFLGF